MTKEMICNHTLQGNSFSRTFFFKALIYKMVTKLKNRRKGLN